MISFIMFDLNTPRKPHPQPPRSQHLPDSASNLASPILLSLVQSVTSRLSQKLTGVHPLSSHFGTHPRDRSAASPDFSPSSVLGVPLPQPVASVYNPSYESSPPLSHRGSTVGLHHRKGSPRQTSASRHKRARNGNIRVGKRYAVRPATHAVRPRRTAKYPEQKSEQKPGQKIDGQELL